MLKLKRTPLFPAWILFTTSLFLLTNILEGALRYFLGTAGFEVFNYVPKILLAVTLVAILYQSVRRGRINKVYFGALFLVALFGAIGFIYIRNISQVLFGAWVLVPLLFGIASYRTFRDYWPRFKPWFVALWVLAVVGVLANALYSFPWVGYSYDVQGVVIHGSRQWTTLGIDRLAGFSRASFAAAIQTLLLSSFAVTMSRGWFWKILVWLASGLAILLTTTKTVVGIYLILTAFFLLWRFLPRIVWVILASLAAIICIGAPLSTVIIDYNIDTNSFMSQLLFHSSDARLTNVWPQALQLVTEHGSVIFGRGIGGIGTAQKYFEPLLTNPADNLFLYLYALGGISAAALIILYVAGVGCLKLKRKPLDRFFYVVVLTVLLWGITTNVLESPFMALFLGLSARHIMAVWFGKRATRAEPLTLPIARRSHGLGS